MAGFKIFYNAKEHRNFIDEILSFTNKDNKYGIGYPRCDDFNELESEIEVYENTIDKSICLIFHDENLVGLGGFLYTEGDSTGYFIGPLLKKEYYTKENVKEIINLIIKDSTYNFKLLISVPLEENVVLNQAFLEDGWTYKNTQREMCFDINEGEREVKYSIKEMDRSELEGNEEIFRILNKTFKWEDDRENYEELLREEYKTGCVFYENKKIIGLVVWAFLQDVKFSRLEYLVVDKKFRGRGIGESMINYVINDSRAMEKIYLSTDIKNNAANLYSKVGFYDTVVSNIYTKSFNE